MKVVKWAEWDDNHYMDVSTEEEFEKARQVVIEELQKTGYHFDGAYHQNGDYGVPVLNNGLYYEVSMRTWGRTLADAFPEEFENPDDPLNYVRWYLGGKELQYKFPYQDN